MDSRQIEQDSLRVRYSKRLEEEENLLTNLTMNFDPFTISILKKEFEARDGEIDMEEFILILKHHLHHWKSNLANRNRTMVKILSQLFKDIDINGNGQLDWDEFTNYIIEKAVINGSEKKNKVDAIKTYSHSKSSPSFVSDSNIEHLINMDSIGKFGVVEDYSNTVRIFSSETGQPVGKNLEITNEIYKLNSKNKKIHRASKKVLVHDGLFLQDQNLVLTSCNDCTIRAWEPNGPNFSNANFVQGYPLLTARNPQRSLTWDESNHLLYSGENSGNINV